jgi:rRNA maturation protein Nop10
MRRLIVLIILVSNMARADGGPTRAKLLSEALYKKQDVCDDARKSDPSKKLALILLATHLCDAGTHVCLDSLRTITDEANIFVKRNFVVYQTRFYSFDLDKDGTINQLYYAGEKDIRDEWNKRDVNPEIAIMDLKSCKVLGHVLVMNYPPAFSPNFVDRYLTFRRLITDIPGVEADLGEKSTTPETIKGEVSEISTLRATGKAEQTRSEAFNSLMRESNDAGVQVVDTKVFIKGFSSVSEFVEAARQKLHNPNLDLFITTSGQLIR